MITAITLPSQRHIADRPASQVELLDDRHDGARILNETADWLSRQEKPDIDQIMPRVERAPRVYQICKEQLDAVQKTPGKYLQKDTTPSPTEPVTSRHVRERIGMRSHPGIGSCYPIVGRRSRPVRVELI